jgi:hypothetical protein
LLERASEAELAHYYGELAKDFVAFLQSEMRRCSFPTTSSVLFE